MTRVLVLCFAFLLVLAGCGEDDTASDVAVVSDQDSDGGDTTDSDNSDGTDNNGGADDGDGAPSPDDDDAADIVGNPDLDLEELAEVAPEAAEALDDIDDFVSIGDCRSEAVGLEMTYVPDGWQCRVLDAPIGGLDGFTLFRPESPGGLEITIGTPSPVGSVCAAMQACDQTEPLDLGSNFDVEFFEFGGIPFVFGTHVSVEAELAVTTTGALSDDDIAFLTMVLDGVVEI